MRAIVKTITYLFIDMFIHATIVYIAGRLLGYNISASEAGGIGIIIEIIETIAYYIHEKIWESISWLKSKEKND